MFVIRAGYTGRSRRFVCGFKPVVKTTIKSEGEGGGGKKAASLLLSKKSPSVRPNVWKKCGDRFLNYLNSLMKISIYQV